MLKYNGKISFRCAGWTYRLMVDEGLLALSNGVANHFTVTAPSSFEWSWGEQEWQLLQSEIPNATCRKTYRYQYKVEQHILYFVILCVMQ